MRISSANLKFLFSGPTINVTQISPKLLRRQVIQGNPSTGGMSTVRFERKGDMVGYVYIAPNDGTQAGNIFHQPIGSPLEFPKLNFSLVDKSSTNKHYEFSAIHCAICIMHKTYSKSTSGFAEAAESKFYPLRFSFCENAQTAIPLIALQYHDVELRITWGATVAAEKYGSLQSIHSPRHGRAYRFVFHTTKHAYYTNTKSYRLRFQNSRIQL
jgi:hypothetical protein